VTRRTQTGARLGQEDGVVDLRQEVFGERFDFFLKMGGDVHGGLKRRVKPKNKGTWYLGVGR